MRSNKNKTITIAGGVIVIIMSIMWLSGAFETKIDIDDTPEFTSQLAQGEKTVVKLVTETAIEEVSGTLGSARQTSVASRVLARVEEVRVRAGSNVNEGDVLIVLDARDLNARVEQVRKQLEAVITKRTLAKTERDRNTRLLREGAVSKERYDQSVATHKVAISDVARLELSLKEAQADLSHAKILAPVSGRVVDRLVEPGDIALAGRALLRIYDPNVLRVEVPVRESLAIQLKVGDVLRAKIPAINKAVDGTIDEIVPFAESGARTLLVKVRLPFDVQFIAGMFAKVSIPAGKINMLAIPTRALERIGQLEFVNVVDNSGMIERRLVTTGNRIGSHDVEVLSGLKEHEQVQLPSLK